MVDAVSIAFEMLDYIVKKKEKAKETGTRRPQGRPRPKREGRPSRR
jgi:hypothetical protein